MSEEWRNAERGDVIPTVNYCDQPYIVKTDDGAWLCCVTTGRGNEGEPGQHVATFRSFDQGKSWQDAARVEPECEVENSYAALLKAPSGRIFIFYDHNTDNVREARLPGGGVSKRVDSLGHFVFKFSDDNGKSWSSARYDIPFRKFKIDLENPYRGELCFFWNVGRPFIRRGSVYVPLNKIGDMTFRRTEGVFLKSPNLLTVSDPAEASWETLPEGDAGLRTPPGGGSVAEEHNVAVLSDGTFYDTFRTEDGAACEARSFDEGRHWEVGWMHRANGREMKHSRAANFVWRCSNGKYLYWFHNHGGRAFREVSSPWRDRNPVWLVPGVEEEASTGQTIRWGEPEIVLYHRDLLKGMSYPDFVEENGRYFLTETEKTTARVHEIPGAFLQKMWNVLEGKGVQIDAEVLLEARGGENFNCPDESFELIGGRGFSFEFTLNSTGPEAVFDSTGLDGRGIRLEVTENGRIRFRMNDARQEFTAESESIKDLRRAVVIVDGGPGVVSFVADGCFLDGGDELEFGWRRFDPQMQGIKTCAPMRCGAGTGLFRIWKGALMTAEAIALTRN